VGLSADGQAYFYQNPLENDGTHRRRPWFGCACCPPNIARFLASLPGYFYSLSDEGVWVHLYAKGTAHICLPDGRVFGLTQHTHYPWDGEIVIEVEGEGDLDLRLRIPAWCESGAALEVNGRQVSPAPIPGSYVEIRRVWRPGDTLRLDLPMPVRHVECHPYVPGNVGRVALMRGPVLYCVEGADNPDLDPRDVILPVNAPFSTTFQPDLLGGLVTLQGQALVVRPGADWDDQLYRAARPPLAENRSVELTAIPYYAWANREPGLMQVWLRSGK